MLKQFVIALVMLVIFYPSVKACDACACTSMNSLDGQLLPSNKNFFGFSSNFVHQLTATDQRVGNLTYSLYGAYSFAKNWQLLANLPMQQNFTRTSEGRKTSQIGLGDASLLVNYRVYNTPTKKASLSLNTLILRGGIKLPTGYYKADNVINANLGTKSVDFLIGAQYVFERNKQGMNALFNARINTQNPFSYKFGNRYDLSAFYFVKRDFKNNSYMPFSGLSAEYIQKDISNDFIRLLSGGNALYGFGGLLWKWSDKASVFTKVELPIYQDYKSTDGNTITNIRAQVQFNYFINKKLKS